MSFAYVPTIIYYHGFSRFLDDGSLELALLTGREVSAMVMVYYSIFLSFSALHNTDFIHRRI